ncbi:ABC transporter ATP-binding protein [Frigoribacterium sp. 2-23]|uniref:ABC transporter ATP-binding protein n=1 Tax=Frigoribacterium sp. 2-23 TaxID=3415006 RepID=UPI003C6FBAA0
MSPSPTTALRTGTSVRLHGVTKTHPNGPSLVRALDGVTLDLAAGSFTAVMGPSGSGKSTLLNCAAGLDTPTSGRIAIGDTELVGLSPDQLTRFRRDRIGFIFQSYNLVDHLTVTENVRLPLLLGGARPDPAWERYLLEAVGLTGMERRLPRELSGGQAQRAAIARALIARPAVVFADEPTGALDSRTGAQVLSVLRTTAQELGQTVVLVTHDAAVAAAADEVVFLQDGRLAGRVRGASVDEIALRISELAR